MPLTFQSTLLLFVSSSLVPCVHVCLFSTCANMPRAHLPIAGEVFPTLPLALANLHFYSPSVEGLDAFCHPTSTSPCICKTRSFGAEMQTDSCMTEKMLRPQRHYDLHSIGQGSWFAITPAHPLANAQGKGSGHKHGEKPQGQEGSSWETTKPPVSPGLSLCST